MSTSIFEIIGPVMVGPSSSHTAGMARIGMMAHRIAGFIPTHVKMHLSPGMRQTYRGHRSDVAILGGILGKKEDAADLADSRTEALAQGLETEIAFLEDGLFPPNTVRLDMTAAEGDAVSVTGISIGGGSVTICEVDGHTLRLNPDCWHLLLWGDCRGISFPGDAELTLFPDFAAASFVRRPEDALLDACRDSAGIHRTRLVEPVLTYGATVSEAMKFSECTEVIEFCRKEGISLSRLAILYEMDRSGLSEESIRALMTKQLGVMRDSVRHGTEEENRMLYGLTSGEDGKRLLSAVRSGTTISGGIVPEAVAKALGVMEHNASMGCIVAAPTAGSAGIIPGCMLTLQEHHGFSDEQILDALFVSAIAGVIMAHRDVSFSGSVGGCQGEVGVSSAIAAAGIASLFSDDPAVIFEAMAICLKNLLGLVCDPIAGPIEVPCIKRNAVGVANAFISADMACAGITSYIPPDQVIDALIDIQHRLPAELRCTVTGGLACADKAVCLRRELAKELENA